MTGHLKSDEIHLDWPELIKRDQTLVVYMGLANLKLFTENLIASGLPKDVAIAVISRGTFPDQKVIKSTLGAIGNELVQHKLVSPTTTIIGDVVTFSDRLLNR